MKSASKITGLLLSATILLSSLTFAQQFEAITTGRPVTDTGVSLGSSWGDFDGDDDEDLFVTNLNHINNVLYRNIGDGILERVDDAGALVNDGGISGVGVWGDIDNDGNLDIFVSRVGLNALYRNDGNGSFVKMTVAEAGDAVADIGNSTSGSWVDFDADGDLDLFVTNINDENNVLYENKCEGYFVRLTTAQVGSIASDGGNSLGAIWQDYDLDGDPDVFVANGTEDAGQQNFLYQNNGDGTFTRIIAGPVATAVRKSVGGSWGDFNNDGLPDLFVTNADGENNQVFSNLGNGNFSEITSGVLVSDAANSVGSGWSDVDNDGDLDLFVANTDDENNSLYINGPQGFTRDDADPSSNGGGFSSGIAFGDYTGDGFTDLYVANSIADTGGVLGSGEPNFLFRNLGNNNNWLKIECIGTESNIMGIGARIVASALINGQRVRQYRQITSLSGSGSQNSMLAHFGLGNATVVDTMQVIFPSGDVRNYLNISANQTFPAFENGSRLSVGDRVLDFGTVMAGDSAELTATVFAGISGQIVAQFDEIIGADADQFGFSDSIVTLVGSKGASAELTASFKPTRNGNFSARVNIETNGGTGCVLLRGIGQAPVLTLNTDTLPFNASEVGVDKIRNLRITNTGQSVLNVSGLAVTGTDAASFAATLTPQTVNISETIIVPVTFNPDRLGDFTARLTVDSDAGSKMVALSGTGVAAELSASNTVDFGLVFNDSTEQKVLRISNPSSIELFIQNLFILDGEEGDFQFIQGTVPTSILPSGSANIGLEMRTSFPGEKRADLVIVSNAPTSPDTIALVGTSTILFPDPDVVSRPDQPIEITYRPPAGFVPDRGVLYYRPAGSRSFNDSLILQNAGTFQFSIPAAASGLRGIEFYARFVRSPGVVTVPPLQPQDNPDFQASRLLTVPFPLPFQDRQHRMVSIPLLLDNTAAEIAFQDLGAYNSWRWRLFQWDGVNQQYVEYPDFEDAIVPGRSYWLVTHDGAEFSLRNAASVDSDPATVPIQPGWNQLANPFAYPVFWSDVIKDSTVENPVVYNPESGIFETSSIIQPWDGFFVYKQPESGNGTLTIQPLEAFEDTEVEPLSLSGDDFGFEIKAATASLRDANTYVGQMATAIAERGREDFAKAPPIGSYLQVAIRQDNERLAGSFLPRSLSGASWDLELRSSEKGQEVVVELEPIGNLPANRQLFVLDLDHQHAIPVVNRRLTVSYSNAHEIRHLRLIYGSEEFAQKQSDGISLQPVTFELGQNYPNPFNPVTVIPFQIQTPGMVKLTVYNILGQQIRSLVNADMTSGRHVVQWNGRDDLGAPVANGIYLYKLETGSYTAVKKMVYLK